MCRQMKQIIGISSFDETIDDKVVINLINSCFTWSPNNDLLFMRRLLAINSNSLGIKYSVPPFNINKKITEKYIKESSKLSVNQLEGLSVEGIEQMNPKILHIFIESGHNLKDRTKSKECNPFFKIYLKAYCSDDRILWTSKPFISNVIQNTAHPKWDIKLDVQIPDTYLNQTSEKIYRQELCIEIYSKSSLKFYQRLTKLCTEYDLYLGSVYLEIGKRSANEKYFTYCIPSTTSLQRLALSNESIGSVSMKIVWGRLSQKGQHQKYFNHHILLYCLSFKWHLIDLKRAQNEELLGKLISKEGLTHLIFFQMCAVSLHNQHQIQSNLTTYEDCIIRRIVLIHFVIEYSKEINRFSTLLAKLVANEDIKRKSQTAWLSHTYIQNLNHIERQFVLKLFESIKRYINLLSDIKSETSESIRFLYYCLKAFRKYHRKYKDLELKTTINKLIEVEITEWITKNATNTDNWSHIITFLNNLSEQLREYWYRMESIIDRKTIDQILNELKYKAKDLIENWKRDETNEVLSDNILKYFLFITEINELFPKSMKTTTTITLSEFHTTEKELTVSDEEIKVVDSYLKQIKVDKSKKLATNQITFNDLKFSPFLSPVESDLMDIWSDLDKKIFKHWITRNENSLKELANQLLKTSVTSILETPKQDSKDIIVGQIATKMFFNAISQLIYFSLAIAAKHYWSLGTFRSVLESLLHICTRFCSTLLNVYFKKMTSDSDSEDITEDKLLFASFCFNTLNVMQKIHLKTDLLELMTDLKASLIHKLIENKDNLETTSTEKSNSFGNPTEVMRLCTNVYNYGHEIEGFQKELTQHLCHKILRKLYEDIKGLIQTFVDERESTVSQRKYEMLEKSLKYKIKTITENVSEKQFICDIILIVKRKGEQIFVNQFEYIFNLFESLENSQRIQKKMSQTLRLFVDLVKIYKQFYQLFTNIETELKVEDILQSDNYLESEKFNEMSEYMNRKAVQTTFTQNKLN